MKDKLLLSDYMIPARRRNRWAKEEWRFVRELMSCPVCREKQRPPEHGRVNWCPNCRIRMQVWGNSLEIWGGEGCEVSPRASRYEELERDEHSVVTENVMDLTGADLTGAATRQKR